MIARFLIVSLCCAPFCPAAVTTTFRDIKRHLQQGPRGADFVFGRLDLDVVDGTFTDIGCGLSFARYFPSIPCPPGSQGLIAAGDANGDGIRDDGLFSSITSVTAATQVEPFKTERVEFVAAPPSGIADILRASDGDLAQVFEVEDTSIIIWWDVLTFPIAQYNITGFEGIREYSSGESELSRQFDDLPWGNYLFSYPMLDSPQTDFDDLLQLQFGVTHITTPDIYPGRGLIDRGWLVGSEEDVWVTYDPPRGTFFFNEDDPVDITGALEVDPKSFFELAWEGLNTTDTTLAVDDLFFSIVGAYPAAHIDFDPITGDQICVPDPQDPANFGIIFPPYSPCTPEGDRTEILINVFDQRVNMPPFFFQPGQFVFAHLRFVRNVSAGGQTIDGSQRSLYIPISFVESWDSFALFTAPFSVGGFPFGTPTNERVRELDFDGDGVSNFYEFALNTDVDDPADFPTIVAQETVPQGTGVGECGGVLIKRAYLSSLIEYEYQHSPNGVDWFTISEGDPDWSIATTDSSPEGDALYFGVHPFPGPADPLDPLFDPVDFTEVWRTVADDEPYLGQVTEGVIVSNIAVLPGLECFFRVVITD